MCLFAAGTMSDGLRYPDAVTNYMLVYLKLHAATKNVHNTFAK